MNQEEHKISNKANFIGLTILRHEIQYFKESHYIKSESINSLIRNLRDTKDLFISLNNLRDFIIRLHIDGNEDFHKKNRSLKKDLEFINHVRNKGVGHLDETLLKKAAQWTPELFHEDSSKNSNFLILSSYKAILESSINSYLDKNRVQKIFGAEIDLSYPPDYKKFFTYISDIVNRSLQWIDTTLDILTKKITWHSDIEISEMAEIAGCTDFNLKI